MMYIIIPTHKRLKLLNRTLMSFKRLATPDLFSGLIVVENGGHFGVKELINRIDVSNIYYEYLESGNKSLALNRCVNGLKNEDFIIFCDDDIRFEPDFLEKYAHAIESYSYQDKVYFGGSLKIDYEKTPSDYYRDLLPISAKGIDDEQLLSDGSSWFPGANWGCYVNAVKINGGFNSEMGPGSLSKARGQESEFQSRLFACGYKPILVEDNSVYHYVPKNRSSLYWGLKRMYLSGLGRGIINNALENKESSLFTEAGLIFSIAHTAVRLIFFYPVLKKRKRLVQKLFYTFYELGKIRSPKFQ